MRARLRQAWQSRTPRERIIVTVLGMMLGIALYAWLLYWGGHARARLEANVATLRAETAGLKQQALELERLRATPATPVSRSDLGEQVQAQIDAAGLEHALTKFEVPDTNQVVVAFGAVTYADWLNWVSSLSLQHVRLAASRIEALAEPGMVGAVATLQRDK